MRIFCRFFDWYQTKKRQKLRISVMKVRVKSESSRTDVRRKSIGTRPYRCLGPENAWYNNKHFRVSEGAARDGSFLLTSLFYDSVMIAFITVFA